MGIAHCLGCSGTVGTLGRCPGVALASITQGLLEAIRRLPRTHYDSHGYYVCTGCDAVAEAVLISYLDPPPGEAIWQLEAGPFVHAADCAWAAVDSIGRRRSATSA